MTDGGGGGGGGGPPLKIQRESFGSFRVWRQFPPDKPFDWSPLIHYAF
jgi:hypothetical protein